MVKTKNYKAKKSQSQWREESLVKLLLIIDASIPYAFGFPICLISNHKSV